MTEKINTMKNIKTWMKSLGLLVVFGFSSIAQAALVTLTPTTPVTDLSPGDTVTLRVSIDFTPEGGTLGGGFDVVFDESNLSLVSIPASPTLGDPGFGRAPDYVPGSGLLESWAVGEVFGLTTGVVGEASFTLLAGAWSSTLVTGTATAGVGGPWVGIDGATIIVPAYNQVEITQLITETDIAITRAGIPASVVAGSGGGGLNVIHQIGVTNNGPGDASDIVLDIDLTLPAGVAYTGNANCPGLAGPSPNFTWTIPALANGAPFLLCSIQMTAGPSAASGGTIISTVTQVSSVPTDSNATTDVLEASTLITAEADLSVTKTDGVTSAIPGQFVTYAIIAANNGPSDDPIGDLAVTDAHDGSVHGRAHLSSLLSDVDESIFNNVVPSNPDRFTFWADVSGQDWCYRSL